MRKKYYIDGNLVRTSERVYTHAVLRGENVISCSGSLQLAHKEMGYWVGRCNSAIEVRQRAIAAIDAGRSSIMVSKGRYKCRWDLNPAKRPVYLAEIEGYEREKASYSIRTLEQRAAQTDTSAETEGR